MAILIPSQQDQEVNTGLSRGWQARACARATNLLVPSLPSLNSRQPLDRASFRDDGGRYPGRWCVFEASLVRSCYIPSLTCSLWASSAYWGEQERSLLDGHQRKGRLSA